MTLVFVCIGVLTVLVFLITGLYCHAAARVEELEVQLAERDEKLAAVRKKITNEIADIDRQLGL